MINPSQCDRGRRGRRRAVTLVALAGVMGIASLGPAGTASAGFTLCKASVTPKAKSNPGKAARLAFSCSQDIRAYGVVSSKPIAGYSSPPTIAGTPSPYVECEGAVPSPGFGCGVKNRNDPADCGRSSAVLPADPGPPAFPAVNGITGPPCTQIIPASAMVTQDITLKQDPCDLKRKSPLQISLIIGGEPPVSSFTPRGDSVNVGEYTSEPFRAKVKGYRGCQPDAKTEAAKPTKGAKDSRAQSAGVGQDLFGVDCNGALTPKDPAKPGLDLVYEFSCTQDIRAFSLTSNKRMDFFGFESEVHRPDGEISQTESALLQCEGPVPGYGFGCGITNRQSSGNRLTAGNTLRAELGFPESPCKRQKGEPKNKVWLTVMGEPAIGATTGSYVSEPFQLGIQGYTKKTCPKPQKQKGGK